MNNKKNCDEMVYRSPQYKMGIKVLSDQQLENILPDYKNIESRIKRHREFIQNNWGKSEKGKEYQYGQTNLMFDNVYSVLGERGSGKTSAIYTLKRKWEKKQQGDIFLPIIMTEMIPKKFDVIGWILSLLESTVRELDCSLKKQKEYCSKEKFAECVYNKVEKSLLDQYEDLKACYFSSKYKSVSENEGFSAVAFNSERKTQNIFDFSQKLSEFWSCLKKAKMETNANKAQRDCADEEESLIYIMFDDVDLAPDKVWEILSAIVKYLSHPNVIVLMTADENMMYEVVKNKLYQKMGNRNLDDRIATSPDWIKGAAEQYLGKILPPSTRYYIRNFNTCREKASFIQGIQATGKMAEDEMEHITVEAFLSNKVKEYCGKDKESFLYFEGKFIDAYLLFFGKTSRQIGNECLIVTELFDDLKELKVKYPENTDNDTGYLQQLYHSVVRFATATLHAGHIINMREYEMEELIRKLLHFRTDNWGVYINYSCLQERFDEISYNVDMDLAKEQEDVYGTELTTDENHAEKINEVLGDNIMLYMLLFFIENILLEEKTFHSNSSITSREKVHGLLYLVSMLDRITPGELSLVCNEKKDQTAGRFLYTYGRILEQPGILQAFDLYASNKARRYLLAIPNGVDINEKNDLEEYYRKHPKWTSTMISLLFLMNEKMYCLNPWEMKTFSISNEEYLHDEAVRNLEDDLQAYLRDRLINKEMGRAKKGEKSINDRISGIYHEAIIFNNENQNKNMGDIIKFIESKMNMDDMMSDIFYWYCAAPPANLLKLQKKLKPMIYGHKQYQEALFLLRAELMRLKSEFKYYTITKLEDFEQDVARVEQLTGFRAPKYISQSGSRVPREDMNWYLLSILRELNSSSNSYIYGEGGRLIALYYDIRDLLEISLQDGDVQRIVDYFFLSKVYAYVEGEYLDKHINEQSSREIFSDFSKEKIPYKRFYQKIRAVRQRDNEKEYYTRHKTDELIKDTVTQYLELLYKSQS